MSWLEIFFIYVLVWWVVIFAVLPFGVQHAEQPEPGHSAGAPVRPRMWLKLFVTTVLSVVVTALVIYAMSIIGSPAAWADDSPCGTLPDYRPSPDVGYHSGLGNESVAPADLYPPPLSEDDFRHVAIEPRIPLDPYLHGDYNADLSDTRINLGTVDVTEGSVSMNGKPLGAPGHALPCK